MFRITTSRRFMDYGVTYLDVSEGILLLVLQVFLQVEEGVEEQRRHFTGLQIRQGDLTIHTGLHHVQHLQHNMLNLIGLQI